MSIFGFNNKQQRPLIPIIGLDTGLIAQLSQAKTNLRSSTRIDSSKLPDDIFGKDFSAPWEIDDGTKSLANRINEARNLQKFVDVNAPDVRVAGSDKDSRSLFALYKGLAALKTLAQFAAEKTTSTYSLARLDLQFQKGMKEVQDFFGTMDTKYLKMLMGDKTTSITSTAALGKDLSGYTGAVIQKGYRDDPLAGINGTETFTIDLTKSGVTDSFTIDLSNIVGPVTINSVVDEMNAQISALLLTDEFGAPILDAQNNPQSKYLTRFSVSMDKNYDYAIKADTISTETVNMVAGSSEPTLYVTGNLQTFNSATPQSGTLTKLSGLSAGYTVDKTTAIQGVDTLASEVAKAAAAAEATTVDKVAAFEKLTGTTVKPKSTTEETAAAIVADKNTVYADTTTSSVAVDSQGNVYTVGKTQGTMGNQINADSTSDVYLTKMDSLGNVIYNRYIGNSTLGGQYDVTVDGSGNVIVSGQTNSDLGPTDAIKSTDAFVTKFDSGGKELFTYQLDTASTTGISDVKVNANGDIYVAGYTTGAISATSGHAGSSDAMVLRISGTTGTLVDSTVFGTAGVDKIGGIAFSADGDVVVASEQSGTAMLTRLDVNDLSIQHFNQVLGDLGPSGGSIAGLAIDNGTIYVAGMTSNTAFSDGPSANLVNAHSGGTDGFVMSITDNKTTPIQQNTTFVGGTGSDSISDITANNGTVYVVGSTSNSVAGATTIGTNDAFVASVSGVDGTLGFVKQMGQALGAAGATGVAFAASGSSVLEKLGLRQGTLQTTQTRDIATQTSAREGDYFYMAINGGAKRKITLRDGETYANLASRINAMSFRNIKAEVAKGTDGDTLRIKAINGGSVDIFAGDGDKDALLKLGLKPISLLSQELLFPTDPDPKQLNIDDIGGSFSLGLISAYHIRDKKVAEFTIGKLDSAISNIQRAYRSLTIDEADLMVFEQQFNIQGTPSAYMSSRIANFESALQRLQFASYSSGTSTFA